VVAPHVTFFRMQSAVHFDNQARFGTKEIGDEWTNGSLPSKVKTGKLFAPKHRPEPALGWCHVAAQLAGLLVRHQPPFRRRALRAAPPSPTLPRGEGKIPDEQRNRSTILF
jgi:hypothetical protein